jgi:argininosuccinate lyase
MIYGELPEAMQTVNNAVALMTEVLQEISFNTGRGKELVESGWILATDLAETLVQQCGLNFRSAHQLVAFLASEYQGKSIMELNHETLSHFGEIVLGQPVSITEAQLKSALDACHAIQARSEPGGTAIPCMNNMIAECRERLESCHEKNQANKIYFASKQHDLLERANKEVG